LLLLLLLLLLAGFRHSATLFHYANVRVIVFAEELMTSKTFYRHSLQQFAFNLSVS
jgi:hypothetical protein